MVTRVNGSGGITPAFSTSAGRMSAAVPQATAAESGRQFDQVELSPELSGESRFQKELAVRLVQEVRAANTTGNIQKISEEIRTRTYRVDPAEIAARMLLEGGASQ